MAAAQLLPLSEGPWKMQEALDFDQPGLLGNLLCYGDCCAVSVPAPV